MEKLVHKPLLNIKTLGISTGRYISFLPLPKDEALVPLGSSIVLWDMENLKKKMVIQSNRSLITCLLRNSRMTVAMSYSGEFKVLKNENFEVVGDYQSFRDGVRHTSLGENYMSINSEKGEEEEGIEIWRINKQNLQMQRIFQLKGSFRFSKITKNDKLFVLEKNLVEEKTIQRNGKLEQIKIKNYVMHLYDIAQLAAGNLAPEKKVLLPHCADILSSTSDLETICFIYSDRFISTVNLEEMNIIYEGQIIGMGGFLTAFLAEGKVLHVPAENDVVIKIDFSHPKGTEIINDIPEYILCDSTIDHGKRVVVKGYKSPAIRKRSEVFTLDWAGKKYYSINENGINTFEISTNKSKSMKISSITGCGITTDPSENYIAYGDLAGNVFVYNSDANIDGIPNYSANLPGSVRSIVWNPSNDTLLIGLMNGGPLYEWDFKKNSQPKLLLKLKRTITSIKFYPFSIQGKKKYILGATTTDGFFHQIVFENGKIVSGPTSFIAHKPQDIEEDKKDHFGTLEYFAEIWSMCWDPKSPERVVTCSEDQTSSVWDLSGKKPKELITLSGHTRAVTCVDWQIMDPSIGEIMISCSDDDTIRIYSPKEDFKLIDVISTQFIKEWHTLTYCALEKGGTRLVVASIIGYLFIYNLKTKQFEFSQKVHMGGIEGLAWTKNTIATCGSDNCVNLIKLT